MYLVDELHLNPITFNNVNLDPTLRYGVENTASYRISDALRLKGDSQLHAGKIPQPGRLPAMTCPRWRIGRSRRRSHGISIQNISRSTAWCGLVGKRFLDGDEANVGRMMVPSSAVVDVRFGGEYENLFWALSVQNVFNRLYFDYGLDNSFPGNTFFSIYPLPGRTFQFKLGARFG